MATTSLSLSLHWEEFIRTEVASGRYASASEVVRSALRDLKDKSDRMEALRSHLAEGAAEADQGQFVADFDMGKVAEQALTRA